MTVITGVRHWYIGDSEVSKVGASVSPCSPWWSRLWFSVSFLLGEFKSVRFQAQVVVSTSRQKVQTSK